MKKLVLLWIQLVSAIGLFSLTVDHEWFGKAQVIANGTSFEEVGKMFDRGDLILRKALFRSFQENWQPDRGAPLVLKYIVPSTHVIPQIQQDLEYFLILFPGKTQWLNWAKTAPAPNGSRDVTPDLQGELELSPLSGPFVIITYDPGKKEYRFLSSPKAD